MVAFELQDVESHDDRLVLRGHWSGVRGLRFMRPTLIVDGREVLATLEHKPWAPAEDRPWVAAFPWPGGDVDARRALLAVAPSVTVPVTGGPARRAVARHATRPRPARPPAPTPAPEPAPVVEPPPPAPTEATARPAEAGRALAERDAARRELEAVRAELGAVRAELAEALRARDGARRERDLAVAQRDDVLRDRQAAVRVRDRAAADRDAAAAERDALASERDEALARLQEARRHREDALIASRTLERRLRAELASGEDREERFERPDPDDAEVPAGVRSVPAARVEPLLAAEPRAATRLTSTDLWVARALGGTAALCFLVLLLTLLLTLT